MCHFTLWPLKDWLGKEFLKESCLQLNFLTNRWPFGLTVVLHHNLQLFLNNVCYKCFWYDYIDLFCSSIMELCWFLSKCIHHISLKCGQTAQRDAQFIDFFCDFQCWTSACSAWCQKKSPVMSWSTSHPSPGRTKWSSKPFTAPHILNKQPMLSTTDTWVLQSVLFIFILRSSCHFSVTLLFWLWLNVLFSAIRAFVFDVPGLLFKRCTLLLPTKERLKFTFSNFSQVRKVKGTI